MGSYPSPTRFVDGVKWFSQDEVNRREAVFKKTEDALRGELLCSNKWNTKLLIDKDLLTEQLLKANARNGVLLVQIRELQMEKVELLEEGIAKNKKLIGCYRTIRHQSLILAFDILVIAAGVIYYVA